MENKRSVVNIFTTGQNDGVPGQHPGHTPYLNTWDWMPEITSGKPSVLTNQCYPSYSKWPQAQGYFNTPNFWSHSEFTPQQTMCGKNALYGYLWAVEKLEN
ncbi:MAG: hypothetical protein HC905_10010 [Bacteroidales bacterium]|nr:hypothetical protein [Bacteroidales bacterium]